ncbi:exodeoxyribonuclease VII large subunit [Tepidibacter formicigenes]|jgi:exodeoxyribonuclease VII large subunit|uniref:Exodeoxyribonuclease 7 large subunit n=1 Tax=Tepidibacter formicigenes DSM 15518 TaxID=1123349 RepID=A0A1M6L2W3_9FIRM|nr:exodeoxyribonuclease VII large subunit [Tepidibacter formicigenes]SHJ65419.1 Exodeoxyribonuclease VII large subunit [Tepidibacter formicigenes DSM 15518]
MKLKALSVSEINSYIKRILVNDPILYNLKVKGEISNLKIHSSGNVYLSLKDKNSKINCVMFKNNRPLDIDLKEGLNIVASGYISLYEKDGSYQFYINFIEIEGIGNLYIKFMKLRDELEKEGLFDKKYKKSIPAMPKNIGVITSSTGAAIRDIINVISRRYPKVNIKIYSVLVQGEKSAEDIVKAIDFFNKFSNVDVIILGRGGGSIEELWSFNEEIVARSIFKSQIPIISAVGHETDFTISDFVADFRAPTPSAAAEIAVPSYLDVKYKLENIKHRIDKTFKNIIDKDRVKLENVKKGILFTYSNFILKDKKIELDSIFEDMNKAVVNKIKFKKDQLNHLGKNLHSLSPLSVMSRGYALVEKESKLVKNPKNLNLGDNIKILFKKADIDCKIENINLKEVD